MRSVLEDFRDFMRKGNVIDLAIAVVIGGAFGAIITAIVNDILMPIVGALMGGVHFSELSVDIGEASIRYGSFIQATINFLIIGAMVFIIIQIFNKIADRKMGEKGTQAVADENLAKVEEKELKVLKEIRDLLQENKQK